MIRHKSSYESAKERNSINDIPSKATKISLCLSLRKPEQMLKKLTVNSQLLILFF